MTLEEALAKIKEGKFLEEDLFEYFGVKNMNGLESALEYKLSKVSVNNDYIGTSFKYIYQQRSKDEYNPLEENYLMLAMILKAFYDIESDELKVLADGIGVFKTIYILNNILKDKPEANYFKELYKQYIDRQEAIGIVMKNSFKEINDFLVKKAGSFEMEDLKKLQGQFEDTLNKVVG
jgi:hypothetical protein